MILFYIFASLLLFKTHRAQEFYPFGSKFEINDIDMFEIYRPNVYIVDLRKEENLNKKLIFTCSSGPKALDLNLTFTGTDSKFITIPLNQKYVLGKRSVNLELNLPLVGEYTGRYNCTALYENNEVETISWYVYFYPGKEDLFLKCPLYGKIPKCLVFYRYKVPFKIPCRALHPAISVVEHTTNLYKFEYDPEQGFYGTLSKDVREFECHAFFDNKKDFQKYELERKAYNMKIVIEAPSSMDFVPLPTTPNLFGMVAKKHQTLNLTCVATVGCNDINYDINFKTNTTDKYKVVLNIPDRSQCLVNYNAMFKFSKSIIIDRLTRNESYFQCEINYGPDLKTPSPQYMVFFPDNPFLTPRPESPLIADYTGVTDKSSFLRLDAFFDASGPITIEWFLNKEKLNTKNYQASETAANKFETDCVHAGIFSYNCFLYIDFYNAKDVGVYEALIRLKEDSETVLRLNISVIMPKSPDTILLLPKYCTQNWTCELNRTTALQCNAQAHRVARMKIFKVDCIDVDDCYRKKTNQTYLQEFLIELLEEEEMTASDPNSPEENKQHLIAVTKKSNLIGEEISTPSYALGDIEKYEYDKDELIQAQLTPVNYDTLETLDSGLTWSIKSAFRIRKVHLIICIANNEIGDAIVSRIILPSGLNKGRLAEVRPVNERDKDREIVEGDSLSLEFNFNNIYYDVKKYKLNTNPSRPECKKLSEINAAENYTYKVVLKFDEVAANCNYNYTMELTQNRNPYFTSADSPLSASTRTVLTYNLDVLAPVKPFFLFPHSSDQNHTILVSNGTNGTNATTDMVVIAGGDTLVVESDKTIELRCENDGRPKPIVTWFKDGKMLNLTEHKFRLVNNSSLKIFRTHQVDSGLYECSVYNRYGQISRHFNVTVNQNTIFIKGMGKRHIFLIAIISFLSLVSLALLVLVTVYLIKQKRENTQLKKKHEKLVDFLNGGNDLPDDIAEELMINSKLENLEKLKFDNLKWEIEETRFLIHDKVLGEGNFGRVCLATVSSGDQLRDESEVNNQWPNDSTLGLPNAVGSKLKSRFSFKRGANAYSPTRSNEDSSKMEDIKEPLLNKKGSRLAAAKMVKDQKVNASDIDALLQELKILAYIGFNLNIIQLFGCYTKDLVARGFACVFVEYCANGDLKHWLRANANKYSKVAFDLKNSMIGELKKRLSAARPNSSRPLSDPQSPTPDSPLGAADSISRFNDTDLTFFAYQIAKGMEYLARKRFLHKDLAARNILLTERFECKISDFGLADESKLTSATFFGRVNSHIPLKWSAPEAILQKRFEANSDIWSFGIVLWEIFTLCENDPYSSYPNKEFMEYMSRENGNVNPGLPENGSNEMHEIMSDCWEVDTKTRPTFEQVVPRIEKLLSNQHKQYYEMLNERFKKVCNEITKDRIFRRDANSRDSGATRTTTMTSPTTPSPYTANSYVNSNQQSNTNSAGYLQPTPKSKQAPKTPAASSSYLEPVSKPIANTQSNDGYLMPQQQKPKTDTYGGDFDEDEVRPLSDTYLAPSSKAPRPVSQSSRFRPPPTVSYINEEAAQFIDQDEPEHQSSGYLAPRQGSQMSTDSNTTTSSTAPLKKRFAPLAPIKATDTSTRSSNNNSSGYIAPEMPKLNKLSLPRTHKETDV